MKSIPSGLTIIIVVVLCGILVVNGASTLTSNEKAIDSVYKFMGHPMADLIASNGIETPHANYISVSNGDSEFWVNADTFTVEGYLSYSSYDKFSQVKLSKNDAEKAALDFAMNHFKDFQNENFQLITSELFDPGNMPTYHFTWREYLGEIEGPSVIDVVINPDTGDILSYVGINRDISIPLTYKVTKEEAVNSANEQFKGIDVQSVDSKLKIWYDDGGSQKLMWIVTILGSQANTVGGGTVSIDANSGEILEIEQFL